MAPVEITDVVNSDENALGVFNILMGAVEDRLQSQYTKGRITGPEYANVYLGLTTAVLQQAISFALTKEEAYQRGLLVGQQVLQTTQEIELTKKKVLQTTAEIANIEENLKLISKTILRTDADIALVTQKKITEAGQTSSVQDGLVGKQQKLYDAQILGFSHDTAVKSAKVVADIWSVQKSADPNDTDGLSTGTLQTVVDKMLSLG